ncbi:ATP-binding protein [Alsobacter sp. R-9]
MNDFRVPRAGAAGDATSPGEQSVRWLRILVWLSVALPLMLLAAVGVTAWRDREKDLERSLQHTLDLVHEHALRTFDTYALVAGQANEFVRDLSDAEIRAREAAINERLLRLSHSLPQIQDVWLLDAQGRGMVAAEVFPVPGVDLSDREYFRVHIRQPRPPYVSEQLRGRVMDVRFFQISWRLRSPEGPFAGVVAVSVQPDYYREFHGRVARETNLAIALMRDDGAILVDTPSPRGDGTPIGQRAQELVGQLRGVPATGLLDLPASDQGPAELVAHRGIEGYPVQVVVASPRSVILDDWLRTMAIYVAIGIPATLGLFLLSLTALRQAHSQTLAFARLKAESEKRQAAEAALRQVQKMEAVGRLTGGVAHDFNNLLTVVIGNLDMLLRRLRPDDVRARRSASLAKEGAVRASLLTQRLLAFSRQQPLEPKRIDVADLVGGMSDLIRRTLGESITVEARTQAGLWPVNVDPNQLESAILNLAVNARDAMPEGGRLEIRARNLSVSQRGTHPEDPEPGDWVIVEVADTGHGIPDEIQLKVFEPFFTTKPHGKGTGLGLSQVYGFIKQSGGHVRLESRSGEGTTVRLFLPRAAFGVEPEPASAEGGGDHAALLAERRRTALVVEDDPAVRSFSVDALRDLGFDVLEAEDAASAMRLLAQAREVDLLFSDIGLPGTDGRALALQARRDRPRLHVLLTSGYAHQIMQDPADDGPDLLPKPFTVDELSRRLASLLRNDAAGEPAGAGIR